MQQMTIKESFDALLEQIEALPTDAVILDMRHYQNGEYYDIPIADLKAMAELLRRYENILTDIACLEDGGANEYLAKHGTYARFDEPVSVQAAREALNARVELRDKAL